MTERENLLRTLKMEGPEWIPNPNIAVAGLKPRSTVFDRPVGDAYDWFGVHWIDNVPVGSEKFLEDITEWKSRLKEPDLEAIDWEGGAAKDCANLDRENKVVWIRLNVGLFERLHALMGFEDALMNFLVEPEATHELLDFILDVRLKVLDKVITYYKPDVICMHDDYGTQLDTFISPDTWREFIKPRLKKIVDYVKSRGVFFSMHSCGKIDSLIGDFVDIGILNWDSVQDCNDIPMVFEKYGKQMSFSPHVTVSLNLEGEADPEAKMRSVVRWYIDTLAKYGGVVPQTDSPVGDKAIIAIASDEINVYGRDYYKRNPIQAR